MLLCKLAILPPADKHMRILWRMRRGFCVHFVMGVSLPSVHKESTDTQGFLCIHIRGPRITALQQTVEKVKFYSYVQYTWRDIPGVCTWFSWGRGSYSRSVWGRRGSLRTRWPGVSWWVWSSRSRHFLQLGWLTNRWRVGWTSWRWPLMGTMNRWVPHTISCSITCWMCCWFWNVPTYK